MIPRCGPQTGLTHSFPFSGVLKRLCCERAWAISKNFHPPLSIFVTFRALGLAELWFNVICRKAKIVNALMLRCPRIKSADTLLFFQMTQQSLGPGKVKENTFIRGNSDS